MSDALIYAGLRSPRGKAKAGGALHDLTPQALLAQLYKGLESRTGLNAVAIDDVILGCVTQHGEQAGNIAKSSTLYAGWPYQVPGITVNRFCSSGIDALALAALKIQGGVASQVLAGGVEMMSRVPMLADEARVFKDPAFATQCRMLMMGSGADLIGSRLGLSREEVDAVALKSQQRAAAARDSGFFATSILPIKVGEAEALADTDECIRDSTSAEGLAAMEPAFAKLGAMGVDQYQLAAFRELEEIRHLHTAGNSPAMADAACVLLLGDRALGDVLERAPRARIAGSATVSADPLQVLTGCVEATKAVLARTGLAANDIDLFEIHEAFAATSVLALRELGISDEVLNVNGGVIALGHPMGATGAIMALTLLDELERRGLRRGIVAAAGAAGAGSALLIDRDFTGA